MFPQGVEKMLNVLKYPRTKKQGIKITQSDAGHISLLSLELSSIIKQNTFLTHLSGSSHVSR